MKTCARCATPQPYEKFYRNKNCKDGFRNVCKDCGKTWREAYAEKNREHIAARMREYRAKNADRLKAGQRAYKNKHAATLAAKKREKHTGFSPAYFAAALESQGFACAICKRDFLLLAKQQVHADHCHVTGRPRGVLCQVCNTGLGKFSDDPAMLRKAAEYLEMFKGVK